MIAFFPAYARRCDEDRTDRNTRLSSAGEDNPAQEDDDDPCTGPSADVLLKEYSGDDGGGNELEVQEQRHGAGGRPVEREHQQDRCETAAEPDREQQPRPLAPRGGRSWFAYGEWATATAAPR